MSRKNSNKVMAFAFSDYYVAYNLHDHYNRSSTYPTGTAVGEDDDAAGQSQMTFMQRTRQQFNNLTQKVKGFFTS